MKTPATLLIPILRKAARSFVFLAIFALWSNLATAAERYLSHFDDLPLPAGLTEQPDSVLFEADGGRIIETSAEGKVEAAAIRRFYDQSLPQLGWTKSGEGRYVRENESLTIVAGEENGNTIVRFSLAPAR